MSTLESRLVSLAQAIGSDVKTLTQKQGDLSSLITTNKSNLVAAINEVAANSSAAAIIDDTTTATNKVWSSSKTSTEIQTAISNLVNGAGAALDTLKELAEALGNDPNFSTTIATALANRVRFDDAQTLTAEQKLQACTNIGIGNYNRDLVAVYNAAKQ